MVKCDPDPPRIPVRLRALYDGKTLLMPVPEFGAGELPWVKLDPVALERNGAQFGLATRPAGAGAGGRRGTPAGY